MPRQRDYYEILGVHRSATDDEIRKAYLKLAHRYHPDKTGGDKAAEDKLKEINAAYDTLKNKERRAKYDQFGEGGDPFAGAGFGGFSDFGFGGRGAGFDSPFEDFFDMVFGRKGGRRSAATAGSDLEYQVSITLRESAFGTKKKIRFRRMENCGECGGSGAAPGAKPETCPNCRGTGQVRMAQGFFSVTRTCNTCRGTGQIISSPCSRCAGAGRVRMQRELSVDIPAGISSGQRLRMAGEGEPGTGGGPRGDLYIYVEVRPDEVFSRDGNDIVCDMPLTFVQAALGATVDVPSLNGGAELKIPAGTQSGTTFRLRGLGFPDLRGYRRGDQIVRVQVEIPTKLSREQKELLKQFEELSNAKTYPLHKRFFERIKETLGH